MVPQRRFLVVCLLPAAFLVGCGRSVEEESRARAAALSGGEISDVVAVSGTVTVDGAPQAGVNLLLYAEGERLPVATCRTDQEGKYCWTTHLACDGLKPGTYKVGFTYIPREKKNDTGEDLFRGRYSAPSDKFQLAVQSGSPQTEVNYDLKMK